MKIFIFLLLVTGCSVNTSGNININPKDIRYIKDGKRCFAFMASRPSFSADATGLGMTYIPCSMLEDK